MFLCYCKHTDGNSFRTVKFHSARVWYCDTPDVNLWTSALLRVTLFYHLNQLPVFYHVFLDTQRLVLYSLIMLHTWNALYGPISSVPEHEPGEQLPAYLRNACHP